MTVIRAGVGEVIHPSEAQMKAYDDYKAKRAQTLKEWEERQDAEYAQVMRAGFVPVEEYNDGMVEHVGDDDGFYVAFPVEDVKSVTSFDPQVDIANGHATPIQDACTIVKVRGVKRRIFTHTPSKEIMQRIEFAKNGGPARR